MFNKEEVRQQIIQYFRSVGSGENILQAIKQALFLNENFSPLLLFELISQGKQKITKADWRKYLVKRNISFSDKQLKYFLRHNHFGQEITLNQFLEAMIPYNADVIRQFRAKYLQSLEIDELDEETQFIFAQLMSNWIGFLRNLIKIRSEISRAVTKRQIEQLVKQDLVLHSKPRQARKFHQSFQQDRFQISFHELRKFLQLWVNSKQLLHQFCLLNVKRHIKCSNPFEKIVYRNRKGRRSRSRSANRSRSGSFSGSVSRSVSRTNEDTKRGHTSNNKRKQQERNSNQQQDSNRHHLNQNNRHHSKYDDYKKQLKQALLRETSQIEHNSDRKNNRSFKQRPSNYKEEKNVQFSGQKQPNNRRTIENNFSNETVQRSLKNQRSQKDQNYLKETRPRGRSNQGQVIVGFLQQIILKQDRLQKLRKQLAKSNDFNIINLFKIIDSNNKGYLNSHSIEVFTQDKNPFYENLVNFYARQKDRLRLQEFSNIFRPLSKQLNQILDKRPQHKVPNPFKKQTIRLIIEILRLQSQMHYNLDSIRRKIRQENIGPKNLFDYIDMDKQGYLTSQSIKQLLEQNNINCQPKDLKCLMKLFNKKVDQKITSKEFINFIDF